MTVEILATGVLALGAPAGLWAGIGTPEPIGWLLWLLLWAQAIASILHVYLRLNQRRLDNRPKRIDQISKARPALAVGAVNVLVVAALGQVGITATWLFLAYLLQFTEIVWATRTPTPTARPTAIGLRQMAVTTLFTIVFVLIWK